MEDNIAREKEGKELLAQQLSNIREMAVLLLSSQKGFRRDLALSEKACGKYMEAAFDGTASSLAVPSLAGATSFTDLRQFVVLAEEAISGTIHIQNPPAGPDTKDKEALLEEIEIAHRNIVDMADAAHRLYQTMGSALLDFDMFNTKNIEAEYPEANIIFDRDALNVAMATARAISERAVRMDIDLIESKERLTFDERQP